MKKLIFLVLFFTSTISKAQQMTAELFKQSTHNDLLLGIMHHENSLLYDYQYSSIFINKQDYIQNYLNHDSIVGLIEKFSLDSKALKSIEIKSGLDSIFEPLSHLKKHYKDKYYFVYTKLDSSKFFADTFFIGKNIYLFETDTNLSYLKKTRIGPELADSSFYYYKSFLVNDSFSFHTWLMWGDSSEFDRVILAKHDLQTGALIDSVFLPPHFVEDGQFIFKFDWVNDSTIIVFGNNTTFVDAHTMQIISQDTLHYTHFHDPAIILSDIMYREEDTSIYYFSYTSDGTSLHRYSSLAKIERYGLFDSHAHVPNWPAPGRFTVGGNHFLYLEYNYLAHISSNYERQLFMCFDEQGDLRWAKIYEGNGTPIYHQTIQGTPDSGMVDFIMYDNPDPNRSDLDAYILKLDKDGNQEVDWLLSSGAPKRLALPDALILYPNPTQHSLHLANQNLHQTQGKISVYDAAGALVLQQEFSPEIEVSQLPPGTYIYSLEPDEGEVLSVPFVVE